MSSIEFTQSFSTSMALTSASSSALCWLATSCFNPRHFVWHATNFHAVHHTPMSPPKIGFAWHPFPLTMPQEHVLQCHPILWKIICLHLVPTPPIVYCVKWHIRCHLNHNIQLFSIHGAVHAHWWLKGLCVPKVLNNLVTHHKRKILGTRGTWC
jgi:hypothetical protein